VIVRLVLLWIALGIPFYVLLVWQDNRKHRKAPTMTDINPTYYSLGELIAQRENSLEFRVDPNVTAGIEMEIALVVERQSMADRINGVQQDRAAMAKARDILDDVNRPYDQDRDNGGPPDLSQTSDHYDWKE
jgi:hypothetical protein